MFDSTASVSSGLDRYPVVSSDTSSLRATVEKQRAMLKTASEEAATLRSIVKTLEESLQDSQRETRLLQLRVSELERSTRVHEQDVKRLESLVTSQKRHLEEMAAAHASEMIELTTRHSSVETALRVRIERMASAGAAATAHHGAHSLSGATPKPLSWPRISRIATHPLHVLRRVIAADQRREEDLLNGGIWGGTETGDGTGHDVGAAASPPSRGLLDDDDDDLHVLLDEVPDGQPHSEDDGVWRNLCRRVHQVLLDRRRVHHLLNDPSPVDFLLRTRTILVHEWALLLSDILRIQTACTKLRDVLTYDPQALTVDLTPSSGRSGAAERTGAVPPFSPRGGDVSAVSDGAKSSRSGRRNAAATASGQADIIVMSAADLVLQCQRVVEYCFTDVDRALHAPLLLPARAQ